jgi:hypothetical protein
VNLLIENLFGRENRQGFGAQAFDRLLKAGGGWDSTGKTADPLRTDPEARFPAVRCAVPARAGFSGSRQAQFIYDAPQDTALMRALGLAHHWQRLLNERPNAVRARINKRMTAFAG